MKKVLHIGLFGFGNVGGGVGEILQAEPLFSLDKICVRHIEKTNMLGLSAELFTENPDDILENPAIDIVIEVIGGTTTAKKIIEKALNNKKHVVTANKALLAEYGSELFALAKKNGVSLLFEASVAGGIPIIRTLQTHYLTGNIFKISGIVNGTCNFILSEIETHQAPYQEVLAQAQKKGFAESDPSFDVEGYDAAQKLALIAHLAFGGEIIDWKSIPTTGISHLHLSDFAFAKEIGKKIRLVAQAEKTHDKAISLSVSPQLVPENSPLGRTMGATNIITILHQYLGEVSFSGAGAGRYPTAMSIVSDLFAIAEKRETRTVDNNHFFHIAENEKTESFYFRFFVEDRPGVLAQIASVFAQHNASISEVKNAVGHIIPMSILTHPITRQQKDEIASSLEKLSIVQSKVMCMIVL